MFDLLNNFSDVDFRNHVPLEICFISLNVCNAFCFHILVKNVASSVKSQLQSEPFLCGKTTK